MIQGTQGMARRIHMHTEFYYEVSTLHNPVCWIGTSVAPLANIYVACFRELSSAVVCHIRQKRAV
jgi:hypothetical protein